MTESKAMRLPKQLILSINLDTINPALPKIKRRVIDKTRGGGGHSDTEVPLIGRAENIGIENILDDLASLNYSITFLLLSQLIYPERVINYRLDITFRSKAPNSHRLEAFSMINMYLSDAKMCFLLNGVWQIKPRNYSIALHVQNTAPQGSLYQLRVSQTDGIYIDYV